MRYIYALSCLVVFTISIKVVVMLRCARSSSSSLHNYILLANSSKTSRIINVARGFYSISLLHTIDQCRPYYPSQSCHYAIHIIRSSLDHRYTIVLAPMTRTILIIQIYAHKVKLFKSLLPMFGSIGVILSLALDLTPVWIILFSFLSLCPVVTKLALLYKTKPPSYWLVPDR